MLHLLSFITLMSFVVGSVHDSREAWLVLPPTGAPTGQPTSQPSSVPTGRPTFQPTTIPTNRPTSHPTSAPSLQPSGEPTSFPTNTQKPTAVPTAVPTRMPTLEPTFLAYNINTLNFTEFVPQTYFCHSAQLWYTPNEWQYIFMEDTVTIGGYLDLKYVDVWVTPYESGVDLLKIFNSSTQYGIFRYKVYETDTSLGVLRIAKVGSQAPFDAVAAVINQIQYLLVDDNTYPNRCYNYQVNSLTKTFHLQMIDQDDKTSTTITRDIPVETASVMYTDALPTVLTDTVHPISITYLNPNQYDPDLTATQQDVQYYAADIATIASVE